MAPPLEERANPLDQARGSAGGSQPLRRHSASGWLASTAKKLSPQSRLSAASFAPTNQPFGNSLRQSVRYLPQNTPRRSISRGERSGLNSGSKLRPAGAAST